MRLERTTHALGVRWLASAADADRPSRHTEWERPMTPLLVPTGGAFDAIELPRDLGLEVLSQLQCRDERIGAVGLDARTALVMFFVEPGSRDRVSDALAAAGLPDAFSDAGDLRYHGAGEFVLVPPPNPCRLSPLQWLVLPGAFGASTDVDSLVAAIVAAHRVSEVLDSSAYRAEPVATPTRAEDGWVLA